jgi:hypothetical protein
MRSESRTDEAEDGVVLLARVSGRDVVHLDRRTPLGQAHRKADLRSSVSVALSQGPAGKRSNAGRAEDGASHERPHLHFSRLRRS